MVRARDRKFGNTLTPHEVEEVVQETVLALWARLARYDGRSPLEAWAYGFVVRKHYKACERNRRDQHEDVVLDDLQSTREDLNIEEWESNALHRAVQALDPPDPEIIHRRHFDGNGFEGIAAELDLPLSTVKTRYYRALNKLRERLRFLRSD